MFCPSKVIRTRESGNFKLVESGIRKISACGIRKRAQGIRNPAYTWNPESTEKESEIQHLESLLIQNPRRRLGTELGRLRHIPNHRG